MIARPLAFCDTINRLWERDADETEGILILEDGTVFEGIHIGAEKR